jgi:DNA polymerase-3 subunit epsilon
MADQIVLDTETTGLEPSKGHRVIEIGAIKLKDRMLTDESFHCYINPERIVEQGAAEIHGLTDEFLADKPKFSEIADEFISFITGAELIIHNAEFDVNFLNHEFRMINPSGPQIKDLVSGVIDTLKIARKKHPGKKNNLDALCKRYNVDNSARDFHGALLDAKLLAKVYLAMTGGQLNLFAQEESSITHKEDGVLQKLHIGEKLPIICATEEEIMLHESYLTMLRKKNNGKCEWDE